MKQLQVEYISEDKISRDLSVLSTHFNLQPKHKIDNLLWGNNDYKPKVCFAIDYTNDSILLKYFVEATYVKAKYHNPNDTVYEDT